MSALTEIMNLPCAGYDDDGEETVNREAVAEIVQRLEAQLVAAQADTAILDWLADYQVLEGFVHVDSDIHEIAVQIAEARDAEAEPSVEDYRQALRRLVRAAMLDSFSSDEATMDDRQGIV